MFLLVKSHNASHTALIRLFLQFIEIFLFILARLQYSLPSIYTERDVYNLKTFLNMPISEKLHQIQAQRAKHKDALEKQEENFKQIKNFAFHFASSLYVNYIKHKTITTLL